MNSSAALRVEDSVAKPDNFNFALDVVDRWASHPGKLQAMQWVSQDESRSLSLTFEHFSRESHRIAVLLDRLGVHEGETLIMILPRVPEWSVRKYSQWHLY